MKFIHPFRSERQRWARPVASIQTADHPALPAFDKKSLDLYEKALPRGVLLPRLKRDRERINYWMSFEELRRHHYKAGQIILGKAAGMFIGDIDDRPMVTIAGARAGKSSTILTPNLYLYPGSMLVLDPKGELARNAAGVRRATGHEVHVLDPFCVSGEKPSTFNFLDALDPESPTLIDDVAQIATALVPSNGDGKNRHFDDNARALLTGIILLTLTLEPQERNLVTARELLCLSYGPLVAAVEKAMRRMGETAKQRRSDATSLALDTLFKRMASLGTRFAGIAAGIGNRFLQTPKDEMGSILSTAAAHTDFLDSIPIRESLLTSDFRLEDLRADRPVTIFLSLPAAHIERQSRWLRLFVQLACVALERLGPAPLHSTATLFLMEEFAVLGHLDIMEKAAAYFPGFGVKLWVVLQDITQLRRHYDSSWESFLGNSGIVQLFANGDEATLRYASGRLDKLIEPFELRRAFARERNSQLVLMEGMPPAAMLRLEHADVEAIRLQLLEEAARTRRPRLP